MDEKYLLLGRIKSRMTAFRSNFSLPTDQMIDSTLFNIFLRIQNLQRKHFVLNEDHIHHLKQDLQILISHFETITRIYKDQKTEWKKNIQEITSILELVNNLLDLF